MKNQFEAEFITYVTEQFSITRKSALRKLGKMTSSQLATLKAQYAPTKAPAVAKPQATPMPITVAANAAPAVTALPDVKSRAANDDTNKPEAPKPPVPSTPAGDARKEGIRLFALAGKPKKEDFIHVYGPMGAKWTWVARAKAVGLNTAEEAAAQFQKMRAGKPQQFVKAEPQPEKK